MTMSHYEQLLSRRKWKGQGAVQDSGEGIVTRRAEISHNSMAHPMLLGVNRGSRRDSALMHAFI